MQIEHKKILSNDNVEISVPQFPLRAAFLLKRRIWHKCFPVNFANLLRIPFLQITSDRLILALQKKSGTPSIFLKGSKAQISPRKASYNHFTRDVINVRTHQFHISISHQEHLFTDHLPLAASTFSIVSQKGLNLSNNVLFKHFWQLFAECVCVRVGESYR